MSGDVKASCDKLTRGTRRDKTCIQICCPCNTKPPSEVTAPFEKQTYSVRCANIGTQSRSACRQVTTEGLSFAQKQPLLGPPQTSRGTGCVPSQEERREKRPLVEQSLLCMHTTATEAVNVPRSIAAPSPSQVEGLKRKFTGELRKSCHTRESTPPVSEVIVTHT